MIDPSRVRHWLRACEGCHPYVGAGYVSGLRVLDLERKYLILAPVPCRYVTLSYMWGDKQSLTLTTENRDFLHSEGNLSPDTYSLAQTI